MPQSPALQNKQAASPRLCSGSSELSLSERVMYTQASKFQERAQAQTVHCSMLSLIVISIKQLIPCLVRCFRTDAVASEVGVLLFTKRSAFNPLYNPRRGGSIPIIEMRKLILKRVK